MQNTKIEIGEIVTAATRMGAMFEMGDLSATVQSKQTGRQVTVRFRAWKRGVKRPTFAEAERIYIKLGRNWQAPAIGCLYTMNAPKWAGIMWADKDADERWVWAAKAILRSVVSGIQDFESYSVMEMEFCGRCGLELTDADSIRDGIGPDCMKKLGGIRSKTVNHAPMPGGFTKDETYAMEADEDARANGELPRTFHDLARSVS